MQLLFTVILAPQSICGHVRLDCINLSYRIPFFFVFQKLMASCCDSLLLAAHEATSSLIMTRMMVRSILVFIRLRRRLLSLRSQVQSFHIDNMNEAHL
jgi:hypothetical protein